MKRATRRNIGAWPNMRDDTLSQIAGELIRARKKHPDAGKHLDLLLSYYRELQETLADNDRAKNDGGRGVSAGQVWAVAATVAAMAIRIMEEGSAGFAYQGNALRVTTDQTQNG